MGSGSFSGGVMGGGTVAVQNFRGNSVVRGMSNEQLLNSANSAIDFYTVQSQSEDKAVAKQGRQMLRSMEKLKAKMESGTQTNTENNAETSTETNEQTGTETNAETPGANNQAEPKAPPKKDKGMRNNRLSIGEKALLGFALQETAGHYDSEYANTLNEAQDQIVNEMLEGNIPESQMGNKAAIASDMKELIGHVMRDEVVPDKLTRRISTYGPEVNRMAHEIINEAGQVQESHGEAAETGPYSREGIRNAVTQKADALTAGLMTQVRDFVSKTGFDKFQLGQVVKESVAAETLMNRLIEETVNASDSTANKAEAFAQEHAIAPENNVETGAEEGGANTNTITGTDAGTTNNLSVQTEDGRNGEAVRFVMGETEHTEVQDGQEVTQKVQTPHVVVSTENGSQVMDASGNLVDVQTDENGAYYNDANGNRIAVADDAQRYETVDYEKLKYGNSETAKLLFAAASSTELFTSEKLNSMMQHLIPGMNANQYAANFTALYNMGYMGFEMPNLQNSPITQDMAEEIFKDGQREAAAVEQKRLEGIGRTVARSQGTVNREAIKGIKLNNQQRSALRIVERIAETTGINFRIVNDANANGIVSNEQGTYAARTNEVTLNLWAGASKIVNGQMMVKNKNGEYVPATRTAILQAAGHELTHFIEAHSGAEYAALRTVVAHRMGAANFARSVANHMNLYDSAGHRQTYGGAVSEVIADAMSQMLMDTKAIERLAKQNASLKERISSFLKSWSNAIVKAIDNNKARDAEAAFLRNTDDSTRWYAKELSNLWDEGFIAATENSRNGRLTVTREQLENGTKQHSFARTNAQGVYGEAAQMANQMQQEGRTAEQIMNDVFYQTKVNVRPSYNGTWVAIIPNDGATVNKAAVNKLSDIAFDTENGMTEAQIAEAVAEGNTVPLGDVFNHKELYKAYPELANMPVAVADLDGASAAFETRGLVALGYEMDEGSRAFDTTDILDNLLHETQHMIQEIEHAEAGATDAEWQAIRDRMASLVEQAKAMPMTQELRKAIEGAERFTNRSAFRLYNDTYGEIEARGAVRNTITNYQNGVSYEEAARAEQALMDAMGGEVKYSVYARDYVFDSRL